MTKPTANTPPPSTQVTDNGRLDARVTGADEDAVEVHHLSRLALQGAGTDAAAALRRRGSCGRVTGQQG
ncbi:hypothetical protein ACFZC3_15380 [Streptomyces sp. NPDC007903]|uniref:hypothetical protein n=1 Tax=Streptomyces sp. NPDC007903 TaxID=3364786 RepID=UPI0036ED21CC